MHTQNAVHIEASHLKSSRTHFYFLLSLNLWGQSSEEELAGLGLVSWARPRETVLASGPRWPPFCPAVLLAPFYTLGPLHTCRHVAGGGAGK